MLRLVIDEVLGGLPASHREMIELRIAGHEVTDIAAQTQRFRHGGIDFDSELFGLFPRVSRLYVLVTGNPSLWAPDLAGIMLRCLVDTAITVKQNNDLAHWIESLLKPQKLKLAIIYITHRLGEVRAGVVAVGRAIFGARYTAGA
jgi:hypothetical protein